jgi:predicted ATPase
MKRIVITGGPCGGKTTIWNALKDVFKDIAVFVPENASPLMREGFPVPHKDITWSYEWQTIFQRACRDFQIHMEDVYELQAQQEGKDVMIMDRGILDGAAFLEGGLHEFEQDFGVAVEEAMKKYDMVIHVESLAMGKPELFRQETNNVRFHDLDASKLNELDIRIVWRDHQNYHFLPVQDSVETQVEEVKKKIQQFLSY